MLFRKWQPEVAAWWWDRRYSWPWRFEDWLHSLIFHWKVRWRARRMARC